jgi:ribosomal protein S16
MARPTPRTQVQHTRPLGRRFGTSDPLGAGNASPDPKEGSSISLDPEGARSPLGVGANPTEAHTSFTTTNIKSSSPESNL